MNNVIDCEYSIEGTGPPLVLMHGIGAARDAWRFLLPKLSQHFTVVTYDLRGHGTSPLPDCEFGLDELVNDIERIRERCGFEQAHFAGHSLGGMMGPAYAHRYPERVLSLGILSSAAGRTEDDSAKVRAVVSAMELQGIPKILETLIDRWFTDEFAIRHPEIIERRLKQVIATDPDVFLNVFRIYANVEMMPWLHEINARSLVLTGELDGGCSPRLNKLIHSALPESELVILKGIKHAIMLEAPDEVADHLIRFCLETSA